MADFDTIGPGMGAPMDITPSGSAGGAGGSLGGWTSGFGIAGLGLAAYGQIQQSQDENKVYQSKEQEAALDEQSNNLKRQQMELTSNRQSMENLRKTQQSLAVSQAAAVNQGAQFGSGAAGGKAQIKSSGATNELGFSQNLQFGEAQFNIDNQIDQQKIRQAQLESNANSAGGIAGIGGDIMKAAPMLAQLAMFA